MRITPEQAHTLLEHRPDALLLDVRTPQEFAAGHIPGAVCLPDYALAARAAAELPQKDRLILVYCRTGRRSAGAAAELAALGYTQVRDFGGILSWPYPLTRGG